MKKIILVFIFLSISIICRAEYNPLETVEEAKERKATDRYYQRRNNSYGQEPLGGYSETLSGASSPHRSSQERSSDEDVSSSQRHSSSYESSSSRIPQYRSPLETIDEQKARHRAEQYEERRKSTYGEPLGGYSEKLGDTEPYSNQNRYRYSPYSED
ncbi:MAG: hypothetical protein V1925_02430 [Candidatus Omnitrophota bacterium]